jgi:hypothetical protein
VLFQKLADGEWTPPPATNKICERANPEMCVTFGFEGESPAIINSETARKRIELYQARGQWGARHFDKVVFNLPIPRFDPKNKVHAALSEAPAEAEEIAAAIDLPAGVKFQRARGLVRRALAEAGVAKRIDDLVARLLDG